MKVLVVGLGGIGQRHVRNFRHLYGDSIRILAARTRGLSRVLSDRLEIVEGDVEATYGIESFDSLPRALEERPDAAIICNPTRLHMAVATAAVEAGCHVLIEKPLSDSMIGVEELAAEIDRRNLVGLVGYQMRFHPCLQQLYSVIASGVLGALLAVRADVGEYLPGWHRYEDYREMYASRRELGGGVILSQIHEIDYLWWLFGMPRKLVTLGGHFSSLSTNVEDTASTLMECVYDGRTLPVHLHQDYLQRPPSRTCEIVGENGKARMDLVRGTLDVITSDGKVDTFEATGFERNQLFLDEIAHFVACTRGESQPMVSVRDGATSLRIALAARDSMETGRVVSL